MPKSSTFRISDLISDSVGEEFIGDNPNRIMSMKNNAPEPNVRGYGDMMQNQQIVSHGNFCSCIPCQALRFFQIINSGNFIPNNSGIQNQDVEMEPRK